MHKVRNSSIESLKEVHSFDRKQVFTLIACIIVVFVVFVFRVNIGLVAPLAAVILAMIGAGNEKKAIKMMPWGSFILVCGVNMLMGVVRALGGIKLLVAGLNSIMSPSTTNPIMALAGGVMSWFSSTTGVVMPTLIPTIGGILEKFPSSTFCSLAASITISSFLAALSPASTGGAGILAQYAIFTKGEGEQDTNKIFARLFISSVACVLVSVILAFIGFYKIF